MEQKRVSNIPTSSCEKIFKALNISPAFRAIRRISYRPQSPIPEMAAASPLPAADPAAKAHPKTKLVALQQPNTVVPIIFESTVRPSPNEKENLMVNATGKPKAEMAEQEKKVAGQAVKATQNSEVTPSHVSLQEKPKPGAEMPTPSKVIVEQSHGQGAKATPKVETRASHISNQVKPVPKVGTGSPAKPLVEQGQLTIDNSREQGKKTVPSSGDRFTDFINHTKFKIRTTSDVGKNSSGPDSAKIKTKTSSSVGGGKSISFKK